MARFWDPHLAAWQIQILPGELYVTGEDEVISTVLGSCVSACVRDRERGIGGMNHFLLPRSPGTGDASMPARYGLYALECLLNKVTRGRARRDALEIKVFGGGHVLEGMTDIGRANIEFVREFFTTEGLDVVAEDLGGVRARRVRYWPRSGRVQLLHMPINTAKGIVEREAEAARRGAAAGTVELF